MRGKERQEQSLHQAVKTSLKGVLQRYERLCAVDELRAASHAEETFGKGRLVSRRIGCEHRRDGRGTQQRRDHGGAVVQSKDRSVGMIRKSKELRFRGFGSHLDG